MKYDFVKVAAAVPYVKIADCKYNVERIKNMIFQAEEKGVEIVCFPELSITGYSCADLFLQPFLLHEAEKALLQLVESTKNTQCLVLCGMPIKVEEKLFNTAVVFQSGKILGAIPKTYLPNYREFQEERWFSPAKDLQFTMIKIGDKDIPIGQNILFRSDNLAIGVEICEDMWTAYTPGTRLALYGAHIIFNLSASNESIGKHLYLRSLISGHSSQNLCGYVYCSCGYGESSTDLVYCGKAFVAEIGEIIEEMPRFMMTERLMVTDIDVSRIHNERLTNSSFRACVSEHTHRGKLTEIPFVLREQAQSQDITRKIEKNPFMPSIVPLDDNCKEIFEIQVCALVQRLQFMKSKHAVVGISGGLDSTLALLVLVAAFDFLKIPRGNIIGVTMPGLATSHHTHNNAHLLMQKLGVEIKDIPIGEAVITHLRALGHDTKTQDTAYENAQARERTQILMDLSNMYNAPVIGTGDLSEIALGWCTYNGDHMSMYSVNAGVPKTSIQWVVDYLSRKSSFGQDVSTILQSILDTPISPELTVKGNQNDITQSTEDIIGPYKLHDFFLYHFLGNGYTPSKIYYLASLAFGNEYNKTKIKDTMVMFFRRFFSQQYKRNCMPDGPKVSRIGLSPRGNWRMPSDAEVTLWMQEIENLPI